MKLYDLDQKIFDLWHVTKDLDTLHREICDGELDRDNLANAIGGMIEIYNLKFAHFHDDYEKAMKEEHDRRRTETAKPSID